MGTLIHAHSKPLITYPVANVPATIGHGGTAMAPSSTPASRAATGAAALGAGTRARVMPAWTSMGTGPGDIYTWLWVWTDLCHTESLAQAHQIHECSLWWKAVFIFTWKHNPILPGFRSGSRTRSGPRLAGAIFGVCWWTTAGSHRALSGCTRARLRILDRPDTGVRNTV